MAINDEVRKRLLISFRAELREHIQTMTDGLLALEQQSVSGEARQELLNKVFRAAHSLKGAARTVDAALVMQMAHALEDVLDQLRQATLNPSAELFTACYQTLDAIQLVQGAYESGDPPPPETAQVLIALEPFRHPAETEDQQAAPPPEAVPQEIAVLKVAQNQAQTQQPEPTPPTPSSGSKPATPKADKPKIKAEPETPLKSIASLMSTEDETIRVHVSKLDALMAQLSELLLTKIRLEQRLTQLRDLEDKLGLWEEDWLSVRSAYSRILRQNGRANSIGQSSKDLTLLFDFLAENQEQLREVNTLMNTFTREYANDAMQMSLVIDELEDEVKRVRMLPLATILRPFGRMVRDLAYEAGKEVMLQIDGADTELDKRVLEQIKDPLIHLLRNAVDHGIETPEERVAAGKPRQGLITLAAEQVGQDVIIRVSDDGRGLNLEAIRTVVTRKQGEQAQAMNEVDLQQAIYDVGISTSPVVTDISGRGIGLDVVRRNVETLHGRIDMDWAPGAGTTFLLTLPLTLSSGRGLLVRVAGHRFAIPLNSIERLLPFEASQVTTLGGHDAIKYHEELIPLARLSDVLELPQRQNAQSGQNPSIIILASAERRMGFIVDELAGEQEIVNKGLGKQLARVGGIAGATVLGSGEILLVLNVADLIKMALRGTRQSVIQTETETTTTTDTHVRRHLLIVDDSITTRTLEKNILEAAGYNVQIATNGQEAWDVILSGDVPDLVVSDVSMPRMNGIELTKNIKTDDRTLDIPVILVTSLDSPKDKARGIEAGADAYITKGTFDQNNLLSTVRQLI